jgi:hypothetical protein
MTRPVLLGLGEKERRLLLAQDPGSHAIHLWNGGNGNGIPGDFNCTLRALSFCRQQLLVLCYVYRLPVPFDDASPNLRCGLALAGLFVAVKILINADIATRAMFAGETIEQAAVSLAAVTMAIAGLLVQCLLDLRGDGVRILYHGIGEEFGVHRRGERSP